MENREQVVTLLDRFEHIYGEPRWKETQEATKENIETFCGALRNINEKGINELFRLVTSDTKIRFYPKPSEIAKHKPLGDQFKIVIPKDDEFKNELPRHIQQADEVARDWLDRQTEDMVYKATRYGAWILGVQGWNAVDSFSGFKSNIIRTIQIRGLEPKLKECLENKNFDDFKKYLKEWDSNNPPQLALMRK